jgi:hypothetical protein
MNEKYISGKKLFSIFLSLMKVFTIVFFYKPIYLYIRTGQKGFLTRSYYIHESDYLELLFVSRIKAEEISGELCGSLK